MRTDLSAFGLVCLLFTLALVTASCSKKDSDNNGNKDVWDIDTQPVPKFVNTNYIDLAKIYRISRFRSGFGHDYSDAFEHCRSMKHYFEPYGNLNWATISVYAPVAGTITRLDQEWAGTKIEIQSKDYPAFRFSIFHVSLKKAYVLGDELEAGELLGTHIGNETMSDISVIVNDPTHQGRMVSYFEVITDKVFELYKNRGVTSWEEMSISKEERDADPLSCSGDTFNSEGNIENWVVLN